MDIADPIVLSQKISTLTPAAIFALLLIFQYWKDYKKDQEKSVNEKAWQEIRNKQLASETAQTEVLRKLTDEVVGLKMLMTKYLIKE